MLQAQELRIKLEWQEKVVALQHQVLEQSKRIVQLENCSDDAVKIQMDQQAKKIEYYEKELAENKKIHQQLEKSNQQISDLQEEKNEITKDLAQKVQEGENRMKIEEKLRMEIESKNRRIKQLEIRSPNKNQKRKKLNNSLYYSETPIKATKMSRF
jgi:hypothetical protein